MRPGSSTARSAVQAVWFWLLRLLDKARNEAEQRTSAGVEGAPSGGGRATTRRGPVSAANGPNGWAGANTTHCAQRLTKTLCGFGAADTALAK